LDLFAGSGALGFEALSRGAKQVSFVDNHRKAIAIIKSNALQLKAENCEIIFGNCPDRIPTLAFAPYDIVFLDPPFHKNLLSLSIKWLEVSGYLKDETYIYLEVESGNTTLPIPSNWSMKKTVKTVGMESYLYLREKPESEIP